MTTAAAVASPVDFETYGDYRVKAPPRADGGFVRPLYQFQGRVSADGATGYPAEAGRYHLYISLACPWAHRSAIVRALLGLQDVVSMSVVDPIRDGRGWAFRDGPGYSPDPVNGFTLLREAYQATEPGYDGHVSVPVLWDSETCRIVSNNFPDITIDLGTQFGRWASPAFDLYPAALRPQIDALNGGSTPRQQRRVPVRVRHLAGGLRERGGRGVRHAGRPGPAAGQPPVPVR